MWDDYIQKARSEVLHPVTSLERQYLKAHSVVCTDGVPDVARVEPDQDDDRVIVYLPIVDEKFFFAMYFDKKLPPEVEHVRIEAANNIYFRATSTDLSFDQLAAKTILRPTTGWSKGDSKKIERNPAAKFRFSALKFDPFPELAYEFAYKLHLLLSELEKDKVGVRDLVDSNDGYIQVATYRHVDDFGGIHLDTSTISRLNNLGLALDFDVYVSGNALCQRNEEGSP